MQYAAALIEYIVTGLISLIWMILFVHGCYDLSSIDLSKYKEFIIIGVFPIAYVSGIFVDVVSSYLLKLLGRTWRWIFCRTIFTKAIGWLRNIFIGMEQSKSYDKTAKILSYSTVDAIRTMEAYVSRDRIARGMALNSLFTGLAILYSFDGRRKMLIVYICMAITMLALIVRVRCLTLAETFKIKVLKNLSIHNSTKTKAK
ncbi:hypothetical protein [Enterobacter sp. UNJFSC 003]|uniref:hypothetical protein n=1 Tax=Enterobacter sp. UNJFSC 003 TaxID=3122077 RepID=UPI002EB62FCF|nr:hypothetical protein [Serratia liquefaciens]